MDIVAQFELLSDAAQLAWAGGALWVLAGLAAERHGEVLRA